MKNYKLLALLCLMGIFFTSCKEESKSEWKNCYGYTNEDVIGTYSFSNISTAFDGVEGVGRHVCPDAEVSIQPSTQNPNMLRFTINCPELEYNRTIEDYATPNEDDFMLRMSTGYIPSGNNKVKVYVVNAHVMKNAKQELRLSGFSAVNSYKVIYNDESGTTSYEQVDGEYYYFDVIKN